jgi:hypothetical protein
MLTMIVFVCFWIAENSFYVFYTYLYLYSYLTVYSFCKFPLSANYKQLLDEAEHDIKNYSDRGQCYLPNRS